MAGDKTESDIRADERAKYAAFIDERKKQYRHENDAILRRYTDLMRKKDGDQPLYTHEQAVDVVRDAFGLKTNKRINNILARRTQSASPKLQSLSEVILLQRVERMEKIADEAMTHAFEELEAIEAAEEAGEKWVDMEFKTSTRQGDETKKISVAEAKRRWYERIKEDAREFFNVLRSTLPQTVVQTMVDNRTAVSQMDDATLDAELGGLSNIKWKNNRIKDKGERENDS